MERLFQLLVKGDWRVLLFLDEFEFWLANPETNKPEFFGSLPFLSNASIKFTTCNFKLALSSTAKSTYEAIQGALRFLIFLLNFN